MLAGFSGVLDNVHMSEYEREFEPIRSVAGDLIDELIEQQDSLLKEKIRTEDRRYTVATEMGKAVALAVERAKAPYEPEIKALDDNLNAIKEQQSPDFTRPLIVEKLRGESDVYRASLELLIHRYYGYEENSERDAVNDFLADLTRDRQWHEPTSVLNAIRRNLALITDLETRLQTVTESLPVLICEINRSEIRDEQAEWEGRDSRTGIYSIGLTGYKGTLGSDALWIATQEAVLPNRLGTIPQVRSVNLRIDNAHAICHGPWGSSNFDREIDNDGSINFKMFASGPRRGLDEQLPTSWQDDMTAFKNDCFYAAYGEEGVEYLKDRLFKTGELNEESRRDLNSE